MLNPVSKPQQLKTYLTGQARFRKLWMIELPNGTPNGTRYYGEGKPPEFDGDEVVRVTRLRNTKDKSVTPIRRKDVVYIGDAPQWILTSKIAQALPAGQATAVLKERWEETFCDLLAAIRGQERLEPILAVELYGQVLDVAMQGSYPIQSAFAGDSRVLKNSGVEIMVNWLDPDDEAARKARDRAVAALGELGDIAEKKRQALDLAAKLAGYQAPSLVWFGWLRRDGSRWDVGCKELPKNGDLFVVEPDSDNSPMNKVQGKLARVGRLRNGVAQLHESPGLFVEGRPLYVRQDPGQ
jgi:hypothetical protein